MEADIAANAYLRRTDSPTINRKICRLRRRFRVGLPTQEETEMTTRRQVVLNFGAAAFAASVGAFAQQLPQKIFRVGHLSSGGRTPDGAPPAPLREGLRGLGYVEGKNIAYEARFAEGTVDR